MLAFLDWRTRCLPLGSCLLFCSNLPIRVQQTPVAKPPSSTTSQCYILQDYKAQNGQCVKECDETKADCIPELCQEGSVFDISKDERVCEIPHPCVDLECTAQGGRCVPDCQCDDPHVCRCVENLSRPNPALFGEKSKCLCRISRGEGI